MVAQSSEALPIAEFTRLSGQILDTVETVIEIFAEKDQKKKQAKPF